MCSFAHLHTDHITESKRDAPKRQRLSSGEPSDSDASDIDVQVQSKNKTDVEFIIASNAVELNAELQTKPSPSNPIDETNVDPSVIFSLDGFSADNPEFRKAVIELASDDSRGQIGFRGHLRLIRSTQQNSS